MTLREQIEEIKLRYPHLFRQGQNRSQLGQDFKWAIESLEKVVTESSQARGPNAGPPFAENWK